jgi:16S rRNA (uracil1498-N3)-methyltransferase
LNDELVYPGGALRLFVESALAESSRIRLSKQQTHRVLDVMRAKTGATLRLFNGKDGEWQARLTGSDRGGAELICERLIAPQTDVPDLWLAFAPIKRVPADYVTQKATELGVRVLQPVMTRRTIVTRINLERMRANAVQAAEQSGRVSMPEVRATIALSKLLADWNPERALFFCDEGGAAPPIAAALSQARGGPSAVLTGPEGGFEESERKLLRSCAFVVPMSLGSRILRADTAALAALAIWEALKGDWR